MEDENGEFTAVEQIGEREVDTTEIFADEGKQFIRIADGHYVGEHITLGTEDDIENYAEINRELVTEHE